MLIILLACVFPYQVFTTISVIDKGIVPLELNSVGIQFFVDLENIDRDEDCMVHARTKRCCLTNSETEEDCDIMHVYDKKLNVVKPRDRETILFIYPTLFQHDHVGFCEFILDSRCSKGTRQAQEVIDVSFDTSIPTGTSVPELLLNYVSNRRRDECSFVDEDPLNNCLPVNCDHKYSEERPFYDYQLNKCVKAAVCSGTIGSDLPDVAYVPKSNICRDLQKPLINEDVSDISRGLTVSNKVDPPPDRNLKIEIKSNCSTVSQNLFLLKDLMLGKVCPVLSINTSDYNYCYRMALFKIATCVVVSCILLLSFICLVNTFCWIIKHCKDGSFQNTWRCLKKKLCKNPTRDASCCQYNISRVNEDVKNSLLRQVIVRDIPMELRDSVVDICERMDRDMRWKKRYRENDLGSQVYLCQNEETSETSSISEGERERLLK